MAEDDPPYESPLKRQIEERIRTAPPGMRDLFVEALGKLDHTDPRKVLELMPAGTRDVYERTALRARDLMPLAQHAHEAGCYIESLILFHGLALFCLRALFVLAWQRAIMPRPLTPEKVRRFDPTKSKPGEVGKLIEWLHGDGLLPPIEAKQMRTLNEVRNRAAHGVIFGEISPQELAAASVESLTAAQWIVDWTKTWFSNPRPLKRVP